MKKTLSAFCILLAVLLGLWSMAAGEDGTGPAGAETGDPAAHETAPAETPAEAEEPAEEPLPAPTAPGEETSPDVTEEPLPEPAAEDDDAPETSPGDAAEELPDASPEDGEEPESGGEETPEGPAETPEDAVRWDGSLRVGSACEISLTKGGLYRLTLDRRTDLVLEARGIAVRITVTALESGLTRAWQSEATEDPRVFAIRESLTLEKGTYSVAVEGFRVDRQGSVSLCFSVPVAEEPDTEGTEPETDPDTAEEAPEAAPAPEAGPEETEPPTAAEDDGSEPDDSGEPEAPADGTESDGADDDEADEAAADNDEGDEAAADDDEADEAVAGPSETVDAPQDAGTADEAPEAAEPLTIRLTISCEEGCRPGARIVLTAVVSDPDYRGTVRWQYSADGGTTVCDVADAEGETYSFILDEENIGYWWRAYLE